MGSASSMKVSEINYKSFCIVDFNFYRGFSGDLIVKELAVTDPRQSLAQLWVFKPPYLESDLGYMRKFKNNSELHQTVLYDWNQGDVVYTELERILRAATINSIQVITCGREKARFISDIIQYPVLDMEPVQIWSENRRKMLKFPDRLLYSQCCFKHGSDHREACALALCDKWNYLLFGQNDIRGEIPERLSVVHCSVSGPDPSEVPATFTDSAAAAAGSTDTRNDDYEDMSWSSASATTASTDTSSSPQSYDVCGIR